MYTYGALSKKVESLGLMIDAPKELFPDFGKPNEHAHPYIEISFPYFYLVVSENGREIDRKKFQNVDMLLYAVFEKITFEMALQYEVMHRVSNQDSRRIIFSYQLNLIKKLSCKWEALLRDKITDILKCNPYQDCL